MGIDIQRDILGLKGQLVNQIKLDEQEQQLVIHCSRDKRRNAIWRRILVRSNTTIKDLHYITQLLMGWSDYHLNRFNIHGKGYGVFHIGGIGFSEDPSEVRLSDFEFQPKERFFYEYDYIDEWKFEVRVEQILTLDPKGTV